MPEAALNNWQPVWNAQVSTSTPVCVHFELRPGAGDIHICWFNFDALAQGNAYKPTKEPINYRGPGGDRTHDLQTEATLPAASCPARTLHATEIASKNATPMTCPRLHWTTDNPSGMHRCQTSVCVNFELRPGAGDIHICWFNFDALAQGNAYKPTKEPINYRGPGGDRTHDLQTEATLPAASCPARTLHATEIASKTQLQWHARGCTGQLTTRLECTGVKHLCVLILNCALALAIYIFVGLILMLWHRETHINPQRNR